MFVPQHKIYSPEEWGRAIRTRRKQLGYTQEKLAELAGCGVRYLSELERGKSTASIGKAIEISNGIGLDISIGQRGRG
ncbi:MAG: helix-turn-helix transcriptional regulator [Raoultibacter sp.]